ncbi:MAG: SMP-30/gluconolactonase/LRE family protein [Caulobacteraceae bacterium]
MKAVALAAALAVATPLAAAAQENPAPAASAPAAPAAPAPAPAPAAAPAPPAAPLPCTTEHGLNFICGLANVEDMLAVDGGKAVLASSYKEGSAGFYLIDVASKTAKPVTLSVAAKPDPMYGCPGAPDLTKLATHGLDVRPRGGGTATVYAINHGGRESVEVFTLDARKATAEWIGCVVAPEGTSANSVVGLRDGSIVFTKLFDTHDRAAGISPVLQGKVTGVVYHWVPGKGTSPVPGTELSGDNGLLASPDGKSLYINAYGTKEVWKVPLDGKGKPVGVKVEFNPDNLRWAPDGNIFVTGQFLNPGNTAGPNDWGVARLDPAAMTARTIITAPGTPAFDNATVAVVAGNLLWLGTFKGDRIAYMPAP